MEKVVVVGGGHVGLTLAVDLYRRRDETGLEPHVVLVRDGAHPFRDRDERRPILIEDIRTGERTESRFPNANIHTLDGDVKAVLTGSPLVFVTTPDIPALRMRMIDWLESHLVVRDATLVFVRGGQGGTIPTLSRLRSSSVLRSASVVLVEDSFYGTRFEGDKIEFKRKNKINVALAGAKREVGLSRLRRAFTGPSINGDSQVFNVVRPLDLQFDPLGYIIHLGVAFDEANLKKTAANEKYFHYWEGVHEGNAETLEALDRERVTLAENYGARTRLFLDILSEQYGLARQPTFLATIQSTRSIYRSRSPGSLAEMKASRIIHEDVPALLTMHWLFSKSTVGADATARHVNKIIAALDRFQIDKKPLMGYLSSLGELAPNKDATIRLLSE